MHSHSKSGSTQGSSPKKSVSLGRTDSNRSAGYDDLDSVGCFPLKTKQEHSETNAFYRAMLDAKAAAKAKAEDEAKVCLSLFIVL